MLKEKLCTLEEFRYQIYCQQTFILKLEGIHWGIESRASSFGTPTSLSRYSDLCLWTILLHDGDLCPCEYSLVIESEW
jgi:hypothetical protein